MYLIPGAPGGVAGGFPDIYLGVKHRRRHRCRYMPRHDTRVSGEIGEGEGGERDVNTAGQKQKQKTKQRH